MLRKLILSMALVATTAAMAESKPYWLDPNVNQVNREVRRADFFAFENADKAKQGDKTKSARYLSMEGKWRFNFVKDHNLAPKDFFSLKFDDSQWVDFPVPGLFELEGYGDKTYKNAGYAWCTTFDSNPPYISETNNYTGSYRRSFDLPADWQGEEVYFHVGSATSNLYVWVNGKFVGYSEDAKVAAENLADAKALAEQLKEKSVTAEIKVGEGGRAFGSISSKEIAELVKKQLGLDIDKKKIQVKDPIKGLGSYKVGVKLHPEVTAELLVNVKEA